MSSAAETSAQAPVKKKSSASTAESSSRKTVLLAYGIALLAQLPMLALYFYNLSGQPHYQPWFIAVLATGAIAFMRWPFDQEKWFHRSMTADVLLGLAVLCTVISVALVEPWWSALSAMLIITSLFARTIDKETKASLWPCALPLFVYLSLPMGMDVNLITTLQTYSARYTSRLLDLVGLGHHMDGTVINVPTLKEYGIEEACSGVQSFFTLLLVAIVFIVLARRVRVPQIGVSMLAVMFAAVLFLLRMIPGINELGNVLLLLSSVGLAVFAFVGFRATLLILSAVFWAVFVNTVRILTIPLADFFAGIDLSSGNSHTLLGYFALTLGILMLLSTDQFLLFMFGPVEDAEESGPFGRLLGKMWNGLSGGENAEQRNRAPSRRSITTNGRNFLWAVAIFTAIAGVWQLVDVQRSYASASEFVRFFDSDMTVDFNADDIPQSVGNWTRTDYVMENRDRGSDLGERSDIWKMRSAVSPIATVASLDQTFPGWHELTTCYKNSGWKTNPGQRIKMTPHKALGLSEEDPLPEEYGDPDWDLVQVEFQKPTGEHGFLLFSHFDAFGEGLDVPARWGTLNSLFIRARNRLGHRIRATLFHGEAYQFQVFLGSFNELTPEMKDEVRRHFLLLRAEVRNDFMAKKSGEPVGEPPSSLP